MARLGLLCLAAVLSIGVHAGPLQQPQRQQQRGGSSSESSWRPAGRCDGKDNVFQAGQTYDYKYIGKAETGLGFADSKTVGLLVDCDVKLSVPEPCELRMKVVKCAVFENDGDKETEKQHSFRTLEEEVLALENREISRRGYEPSEKSDDLTKAVSQYDIQAQISNGEVSQVVYEEEEETWVVNFKKGILDALQVRTDVDTPRNTILVNSVQGLCPTKYSSHGNSDSFFEDKDLDSCIHRSKKDWELSPLTPIWNMSFVSAVMSSRALCSYKLQRNSHVQSMVCRETHRLLSLPWNAHVSAMTANVTQSLKFLRHSSNAQPMDRRMNTKEITSILYEHENSTDIDRDTGDSQADEILEDLVKQAVEGFDIGSPAVFDDFVDELRDTADLTPLVQKIKNFPEEDEKEVAKYLVVQGLIQCNAPACLRALTTLIQDDEIPSAVFEPVIMALALTKQQDPLFLAEITRMCEANPSRTCMLMVGAMTYKLIEDDEDDDDSDILDDQESAQAVKQSIKFITELLDDSKCEPSNILDKLDEDDDATKLIVALKSIGNLGKVAQEAEKLGLSPRTRIEQKIAKCIMDRSVPNNVSIAALQAFRKFVPNQFISEKLVAVLADPERPVEVRLAACMSATRMASEKTAVRNIIKAMENERSEQVKAFMVSHLRSVLNSEDPNYKEIAELVKQVLQETGKSLPKTKARLPHSVHLELSKFYEIPFLDKEENDFGAQVESSIIFTPKSYMPKSIHLNVSGQAWSDYVNILETGVDFQGTEDLVEKVLGPNGILSKSKALRKIKEALVKGLEAFENVGYKYLRMDDMKEYGRKAYSMVQTESFDQIIDRVLSALQDVDTSELEKILSHARNFDTDQLLETIKRNIPQSAQTQMNKVVEKLKRINLRDISEETLVEVLEAFGVPERKSRDILSQVQSYGVNVNEIIRWLKRQDLSSIQENLRNLRTGDVQDKVGGIFQKVKQFLSWIAEKYDLPDFKTLVENLQKVLKNPSEIRKMKDSYMESRKNSWKQQKSQQRGNKSPFDEEDEDAYGQDEDDEDNENDEASLNQVPWGRNVKSIKRQEDDDDDSNDDDDEDLDITAFVRILGNEIGFVSLSDILEFFDIQKLMTAFNVEGNWREIMDGFDIRPTIALKTEGIHHISTGLGLPLQITLNLTGIATVHVKMQPQGGSSFRKSQVEFEPSGAFQIAGGMAIDLPSITKIATVSNTTVGSEFELKVRVNLADNAFDVTIEKPDEELDILHIRHELKLVKDDEDYPPMDESKSNEVNKQKCLPEIVERYTGLKVCAELETSTIRGSKMLSHGPHELRVSVQESGGQSGLQHVQFSGKKEHQTNNNRFEVNFRAPSQNQQHRREIRAVMNHDRQRNDVDLEFDAPDQSTPRMRVFVKNLAPGQQDKYGVEAGFDLETTPQKHYNASITVIGKFSGYGGSRYRDERISDVMQSGEFNYTVKGSLQSPQAWINVSTTTAKIANTLLMEHNLTYFISEHVQLPILKKLRFPNAQERHGVSKFVLRHGLKAQIDQSAYDMQAFIKFITFPLLNVPEPTFSHVTQLKVHRDYRHVGLHANTTWLNSQHELEFFNASLTANNLNSLIRLSEPATIRLNISRNDWHVAGKSQLRKEGNEINLLSELTAFCMIPDCNTVSECAWKRLKTEAKSIADAFKTRSLQGEPRPHTQHRFRQGRSLVEEGSGGVRPKKVTIAIDSKLRQKSGSPLNFESMQSWKNSPASGRVWELRSTMSLQQSNGSPKEMQSVTTFGNDVSDRDTFLNLFVIHNQTATNIPYSFDHFAQLLVSREEGLLVSVNTSIDKSDESLFGVGVVMQVDPNDKRAHIGINIDTPFLDVSGRVAVAKPQRGPFEIRVCTKTESDQSRMLNHEIQVVSKIGMGKVSNQFKLRHPKLETELKSEIDLYSEGSDSDFDAGVEFDNTDYDENDDDDNNDDNNPRTSGSRQRTSGTKKSARFESEGRRSNQPKSRNVRSISSHRTTSEPDSNPSSQRKHGKQSQRQNPDSDYATTTDESSFGRNRGKSSRRGGPQFSSQEETTTSSWESQDNQDQSFPPRRQGSSSRSRGSNKNQNQDDSNEEGTSFGDTSASGSRSGRKGSKHTTPRSGRHGASSWNADQDENQIFGRSRGSGSRSSKQGKHQSSGSFFGNTDEPTTTSWEDSAPRRSRKGKSGNSDTYSDNNEGETTTDYSSGSSSRNRKNKDSSRRSSSSFFGNQQDQNSAESTTDYQPRSGSSFGRQSDKNSRTSQSSSRKQNQGSWNFFGGDDANDSQEQGPASGRKWRSQNQRTQDSSEQFGNQKSGKYRYTAKGIRNSISAVQPKVSAILRIKSLDRELFPSINVEAKATIRKVSVEVDIREVPRALQDLITATKFSIKGQIQDQKATLKLNIGQRGEAGIELHVRSQREATGKIYDRGLTTNGETVHAQVTVGLPTDNTISIKFKVDPESSSKFSRNIRETSRKAYDYSRSYAKDKSEQGLNEARRLWSNQDHPAYKYTQPYFKGTMEDWKNDAVENGKRYYQSSKDYANSIYSDDSILGTSVEDMIRQANQQRKKIVQYIMELIRDTPAGEWVDAFPSFDEAVSKISDISERQFGPQIRIIKQRKSCILMQSCDAMGSLRAVQSVAMELSESVDPAQTRDLVDKSFKFIQELLLSFVKSLKEKSRHNELIRSVLSTVDLNRLEENIARARVPSIDTAVDAVKTVLVLIKDLAVQKFDAVTEDRDGSVTIVIPHPFKWSSFKEMPRWTDQQREKSYEYFEKSKRALSNFSSSWKKDASKIKFPGRDQPVHFRWSDVQQFPKKNMPSHTAMIFGDRHVMTFDGKVYALPESADQKCTYLLARGMKQKNFALVKDKNTVTLTVPEMVISINEKNEVRINNTLTQLPVESQSKRTKVVLVGDTVEVESDIGISLKVTGEKKVIIVQVSMGLWDETSGVLGSNDNEASNDWEMPSGKRAGHVEEFLNSYEVSKAPQCKLVKGQEGSQRRPGQQCAKSTKCAQLFGSSASPLNQCFQSVDPEEFKEACEAESNQCARQEADESVCNIVSAYRKVCAAEDVETEAPEDCETCEGGRKENSQWNVRGNQKKVDAVILVSEHRDFSQGSASEKIRSLVEAITRKLRQSAGQDVRVALAGFSGAGVHKHGHTHSIDSELFGSADKLAQALRTLQFKGTEKTDALEAVNFILDSHDFRPEASKILLVFGAEESELISGHESVQSVQEKLTEQGVTLTVFSKYGNEEIKERDHGINYDGSIFSSKSSSKQQQLSFSSSSSDSSGSFTGQMPKRRLSYLAKSSRGAVFQLDNLVGNDRSKQQQLEERAADAVMQQIKREEQMCKTCVCKETDLQQLISACRATACA